MYDAVTLGERIRYFRKQRHLSQKQLADLVNMKQSTISELERGSLSLLNISKLDRIAQTLQVSLDDLLLDSLDVFQQSSLSAVYRFKLNDTLRTLDEKQLVSFYQFVDKFIVYKKTSQIE